MGKRKTHVFILLLVFVSINGCLGKPIFSSRLIHRFSGESETTSWPEKKSFGQMRTLLGSDLKRQRLKLSPHNQTFLAASEGSQTFNYGNDMGWLHYTWIDIGTPNTSFLVALDTGSDTSWLPCECIECAPLSLSYYNNLDRELSEYNPSHSNSSKHISCSHELCEMGPNCKTPTGHCPYTISYMSVDTSSSGYLFEDKLHLSSVGGNKLQSTVQASVVIGCGSKQSGSYLVGIAPDGLMGLGPGDISIPSLLAKSGLVSRSFSFCYDKSYTGTLFFGDQGPSSQKSTSFVTANGNRGYFVKVDSYCLGHSCLKDTGHIAQVDTGSSFTFLPSESYDKVVSEFHRRINATRVVTQGFEYCYETRSLKVSNIPSLKLVFSVNQSFTVEKPMFRIVDDQGDLYCLGVHATDKDSAIIGQNFMMGYRMVFDWENLKLGWSISNCQDIGAGSHTPPISAPLPTDQQQQNPHEGAVAPAFAGRTPPKPSAASPCLYQITSLLLLLCTVCISHLS